ncbi:hypothetical protein BDZ91DRAFT_747453 [Kalaharituber pfeilii]|nr:hypothetical protein BDZ91DRAFT_747453 [Kalaharituber pfeilii]
MPDSLIFNSHSAHSASSPTPVSSSFLSPGAAPLQSQPTSPSNTDQKPSIIAKGKVKAKDPPPPIQVPPHSPPVKRSGSPSESAPSSPQADVPTSAELHLNQYVTRDLLHAAALASQAQQHNDLIRSKRKEIEFYQALRRERAINPGAVFGYGYQGYGNGYTNGKPRILYPCERKKPGSRKSRELRVSRSSLLAQAEEGECLVPIRLDIDYDKIRLRDTFTWNLHDRTVPIELFAEQLVEDFHLPLQQGLIKMIADQIHAQVTDFHPHVHLPDEPVDPKLPYWAYKNDEMRVLIKLNITIGQHTLVDQFEWDINNPANSPEGFANQMAKDMCLSGEFTTAIAHSIREQCQLYTKYLYQTGHTFDGRPVEDPELKTAMLPSPLPIIVRSPALAKEYEPVLYELSEGELERLEKDLIRESRRKRRVSRRGGPSLPDLKEVPKTNRSQIVSSVLPGAVLRVQDMRIMLDKPKELDSEDESGSDTPPATPPPPPPVATAGPSGRRGGRLRPVPLGRSATPEVSQLLHHVHALTPSVPLLPRRPGVPFNVESALLKLKISREKLARWVAEQAKRDEKKKLELQTLWEKQQREREKQAQQQQQHRIAIAGRSATPAEATPRASGTANASTPAASAARAGTPAAAATPSSQGTAAAVGAAGPAAQQNGSTRPDPGNPPPTPDWLLAGLQDLQKSHPNDNFEGIMKYTALDGITDQPITANNPPTDPNNIKHKWFPRIRCHDCPGKLYTPGPERTVDNFKLHLINRGHRAKVEERVRAQGGRK